VPVHRTRWDGQHGLLETDRMSECGESPGDCDKGHTIADNCIRRLTQDSIPKLENILTRACVRILILLTALALGSSYHRVSIPARRVRFRLRCIATKPAADSAKNRRPFSKCMMVAAWRIHVSVWLAGGT